MERHRGHFLNWYDTRNAAPLTPLYVSTVDSGNLCTHLIALAQACLAACQAPLATTPLQRALALSLARIAALRGAGAPTLGGPVAGGGPRRCASRWRSIASDPAAFAGPARRRHGRARRRRHRRPASRSSSPTPAAAARLGARGPPGDAALGLAQRRSGANDASATARLIAIATTCQRLAGEPDFGFLFHRKRRLFHIGFRVAEHQLDSGFYDLLASEARATSLWAIAKGDVAAAHWAALGRPFYAVGALAGLRSWSGSMFEYLMPTLVLDEPYGSVLHSAALAAVQEHIAFAREHHVPWGISECAYAASDHTLAYQYAPQGVPRLALRRTPSDELVVAPYATALAAQVAPHRATTNLRRLEQARARGRYGFIEALDYTPGRQQGAEGVARVFTFMAHHQGMSIVALANVLLDGAARHWGMADARVEAVASLLHERAPREVPPLRAPPASPTTSLLKRPPGMFREIMPGMTAIEPTHLLSNGRYAVALRANGAGVSRWGNVTLSRARDDALRDAYGCFFHLRWDRQPQPVSLTQHPAPDSAAHYHCSFHADRVVFDATWPEVEATTTVWVSPEDDIEFRRIVLHNYGDRTLDLELMSAFEVTLADPRADEAHPAFSNLFVSAEWQAQHQALVFARKPRLATDKGLLAANFLAGVEPAGGSIRIQVDRLRWLGRNRAASHPLASFDEPPPDAAEGAGVTLDTGLDPVAAFAVRLQIAPKAKVQLTFCTAAADDPTTLRAVIDKYRQLGNVERASLMSATLTGIRLREMRINAENFAAIQTLSTTLALSLTRTHLRATEAGDVCDRRLLWRFGISGDRPIVLVSAGVAQGGGLLRSLAQALRLWSWGGIACDLVVINFEPTSYLMPLNRSIAALKEQHAAAIAAQPGSAETGFHLLQASDLSADEVSTLRTLARVRFSADGRPLAHHVEEFAELHERAFQDRQAISCATLSGEMGAEIVPRRAKGDFAAAGGEFRFDVTALMRPARPWVNVLANPDFGAQISEAGGGYTLGPEQPPEHAHAVVERRRRRPGRRMVPAPGPAHHAGLERDAVGRRRLRLGLSRRPRPGLQHRQPSPRRARLQRHLVRRRRNVGQAGARSPRQSRPPDDPAAPGRHRRVDPRRAAQRSRQQPHPHGDDGGGAGERRCTDQSRRRRRRGAPSDRALLHPARPLGRLRRRHRLLRPRRRSRGPRRLDLRPARDLRRPRPRHRPRPLRPGERLRPRPVRRALDPRHAARRRFARARVPARLRRQPGSGRRARRQGGAGAAAAPPAAGAGPLGRAARRGRGANAGPAVRRDGQPLAALPDDRLPPLGARRLLPGRRRLRLSRPAAGRDGARLDRARDAAPADRPRRLAPVRRRRRPALVACADRRRRAHPFLRRPALAALHLRPLRRDERRREPCSTMSCPSSKAQRFRKAPKTRTTCRRSAKRRRACSSTARARSTAASRSARTACR